MSWIKNGFCVGLPTDWFFPPRGNSVDSIITRSLARTTCSICPYKDQCSEEFEELKKEWKLGIWGGLTEKDRKRIKKSAAIDGAVTAETIIKRHQKEFLSERTQNRMIKKSETDPKVKQINEWLIYELGLLEPEEETNAE